MSGSLKQHTITFATLNDLEDKFTQLRKAKLMSNVKLAMYLQAENIPYSEFRNDYVIELSKLSEEQMNRIDRYTLDGLKGFEKVIKIIEDAPRGDYSTVNDFFINEIKNAKES